MFPLTDAVRPRTCACRIPTAVLLASALFGTAGCQSAPVARSGFLTSYSSMPAPDRPLKRSSHQWRDDRASDTLARVYIEPAIFGADVEAAFSNKERAMVLREVNRQICFEVSKRFRIAHAPAQDAGTVRTAIVRLRPNSRAGSAAEAAIDFVNPIPVVNFRLPATTGGLAVESELLDPAGTQIAAIAWRRNARMIGRIKPSLSKAGDALQLAEPLGDSVAKAFASRQRARIDIGDLDPCSHLGARKAVKRSVASGIVGGVTGLYVPQVAGTSIQRD